VLDVAGDHVNRQASAADGDAMSNDWRTEHEQRVYRMTRRAERAQKVGIGMAIGCGGLMIAVLLVVVLVIAVVSAG
jgi:hypothetical protein